MHLGREGYDVFRCEAPVFKVCLHCVGPVRIIIPKAGWAFACQAAEQSVEVRQGLEADHICDVAYRKSGVHQKIFRFFHAYAREVVGEG